jgi:hypothetical protein
VFKLTSHTPFTTLSRGPANSFVRRVAVGLIAAPLTLGAGCVAPLVLATPASACGASLAPPTSAAIMPQRGAGWRGFYIASDGANLVGARTAMNRGGSLTLVASDDATSLILSDPRWNLRVGRSAPVRLEVDGNFFTGSGTASCPDSFEIPNVALKSLKKLAVGAKAIINVDNGRIIWIFDLDGLAAAITDATQRYEASYVSGARSPEPFYLAR